MEWEETLQVVRLARVQREQAEAGVLLLCSAISTESKTRNCRSTRVSKTIPLTAE